VLVAAFQLLQKWAYETWLSGSRQVVASMAVRLHPLGLLYPKQMSSPLASCKQLLLVLRLKIGIHFPSNLTSVRVNVLSFGTAFRGYRTKIGIKPKFCCNVLFPFSFSKTSHKINVKPVVSQNRDKTEVLL
jgi:hypothetical protein